MIPPGFEKIFDAIHCAGKALLFLFLFGFIAVLWKQLAGT